MSRGQLSQPPDNSARDGAADKTALRDQLLTTRRRRSLLDVGESAVALSGVVLDLPEVRRAATVACYVSMGHEPGTSHLLAGLDAAGKRVLLPVLLPDGDLDWGVYAGDQSLVPARMGLLEPDGPRLGVDAIATADVVLVPGLAVSSSGMRMGRGGGSYDRALGRVPVGTPTACLLYDDEVGIVVPVEPHDRPVLAAVTPTRAVRFPAG